MSKRAGQAELYVERMFHWHRQYGPAAMIALEALGSADRLRERGVVDGLGEGADRFIDLLSPPSRGGRHLDDRMERVWDEMLQMLHRHPAARASIAKLRRFDAAGDVQAIYVELAYWLGVGEGFRMPAKTDTTHSIGRSGSAPNNPCA